VNDASGVPLRAQALVVRAHGKRPLAYVTWTRDHVEAFASAGCVGIR
jgi:hypothetical protein